MAWMTRVLQLFEAPLRRRQQRLMQTRLDYRKSEFCDHFGNDSSVASVVWDTLQKEAVVEGFKPKPGDDLHQVFGLMDEDLDDVALRILTECGCRVPLPTETAAMRPVTTTADLVSFVSSMAGETH
jgi:hypothetical protein